MTDIQYFAELYTDFEQLVAADSQRESLPTSAREHSTRSRRRGVRLLGPIAVIGCAAVLGAIFVVSTGREGSRGGTNAAVGSGKTRGTTGAAWGPNLPLPAIGHDPFTSGGRRVSLTQAIADAGYSLPIANAQAANPRTLSAVWISRASKVDWAVSLSAREVVFDYATTGIRVFVKPAPPAFQGDARRQLEATAQALHLGRSAIQTIDGSVLLAQAKRGGSGGPAVEMIYPGATHQLEIAVIGSARTTTADLVAVARSLAEVDR